MQNESFTTASVECATPTGGVSRRSKENALFLGVMVAMILTTVNISILIGMREVATRHLGLSADLAANAVYLSVAILAALIVDAKALVSMFVDCRWFGNSCCFPRASPPKQANAFITLFGLEGWERAISTLTVTVNWMVANGVCCSAVKLWMNNPLNNYATLRTITPELAHDLVVGNVQIIPLFRSSTWEGVYGIVCVCYLTTFFAISAANKVNFRPSKMLIRGTFFALIVIGLAIFSGLFRWVPVAASVFVLHLGALGLAYARGRSLCLAPKHDKAA